MAKVQKVTLAQVLKTLQEVKGKQKDCADKLQVSQATVSRILSNNGYVPEITWVKANGGAS